MTRTFSHGGPHWLDIHDPVTWHGQVGRVVSLSIEPTVGVEFPDGNRIHVGQSALQRAETPATFDDATRPSRDEAIAAATAAVQSFLDANYPCHCGDDEDCPKNSHEADDIVRTVVERLGGATGA